jgi:hypothetical protein
VGRAMILKLKVRIHLRLVILDGRGYLLQQKWGDEI